MCTAPLPEYKFTPTSPKREPSFFLYVFGECREGLFVVNDEKGHVVFELYGVMGKSGSDEYHFFPFCHVRERKHVRPGLFSFP